MTAQSLTNNKRLLILFVVFLLLAILAILLLVVFRKNNTNSQTTNVATSSATKKATSSASTTGQNNQTSNQNNSNTGSRSSSSGSTGGSSGKAGTNQPVTFAVTAASVSVTPTSYQFWDCATDTFTFTYTGSVTTNAAGDVTYYWTRQSNPNMIWPSLGTHVVHFNSAGTQAVTYGWNWTGTNTFPPGPNTPWSYQGTATLHITSPAFTPNPDSASYTVIDPLCVP